MIFFYGVFRSVSFGGLTGLFCRFGLPVRGEDVRIAVVSFLSFLLGVTNSFFWNSRFVFKKSGPASARLGTYLKTLLCYGVTGLLLAPCIKIVLRRFFRLPYYLAVSLSMTITFPVNYLLNRFWAYAEKSPQKSSPGLPDNREDKPPR